jgi:hypothetical protein
LWKGRSSRSSLIYDFKSDDPLSRIGHGDRLRPAIAPNRELSETVANDDVPLMKELRK